MRKVRLRSANGLNGPTRLGRVPTGRRPGGRVVFGLRRQSGAATTLSPGRTRALLRVFTPRSGAHSGVVAALCHRTPHRRKTQPPPLVVRTAAPRDGRVVFGLRRQSAAATTLSPGRTQALLRVFTPRSGAHIGVVAALCHRTPHRRKTQPPRLFTVRPASRGGRVIFGLRRQSGATTTLFGGPRAWLASAQPTPTPRLDRDRTDAPRNASFHRLGNRAS